MITGAQSEFIDKVASIAITEAPKYGIHVVSPIIAQAIIESNWGKSGLATKGLNLFGIKCGSTWTGASINMTTKEEYQPGTLTTIKSLFRKYNSWDESVLDYFKFINTKRYAKLKECTTPRQYCEAIKEAGYATSSTYVNTLMNCINSYNLMTYDALIGKENIPDPPKQEITAVIDYSKVVDDVKNNIYGSGTDRIIRLAKNGYNPLAVQYMVNLQCQIDDLTKERETYYNIISKLKEVLT